MPATAVSALPPDASQGTPGMAPATADSPVPALSQPSWRRGHQWQCSEAEGLETGNQVKHMAHEHHANSLPSELNAPLLLNAWRRRALVVGAIFAVLSIVLAVLAATVDHDGIDHLLRSWLLGYMICWGFTVGGLALLMVQYLSGGKWGLLIRRPLEAMSRCLPLVIVMFLPIGFFMKKLYLWAQYSNPAEAYQSAPDHPRAGARDHLQAPHAQHPQRLGPVRGLLRDLVPLHVPAEQVGLAARCRPASQRALLAGRLENLSGFGILVYSITLTRLRDRLGHVARPHLVLLDVRPQVPGWPGLRGAGALRHHGASAFSGGADEDGAAQNRAARPGQAGLRLRHAEHLSQLLPVPDHLVGQPAGGDSLVSGPHSRRLGL